MPRNRAHLETQVRQINQMFGGTRPIIEITKPCNLHNRKGSIDIIVHKAPVSKRNSIDTTYCSTDRLNSVQRRAKSVDHTALSKSINRNSSNSTNDLFSGKYVDVTKRNSLHSVFGRSEKELRRKSYFDGMEHPADFPAMLRNFQALSADVSKTKSINGHNSNNNLKNDTNNNSMRLSVTPERKSFLDTTDSYLRKPKRLSFETDSFNHSFTSNTNRKLSCSSSDSLECLRSPTRRHSSIFHSSSPKPHYFDSADIEKEVRDRV